MSELPLYPHHSHFSYRSLSKPDVSVVVSLYNYSDRISFTLDGILSQSLRSVELVVVDDCSTDSSCDVAVSWLKTHYRRFVSAFVIKHLKNSGLAAARNSGFAFASASWIWVQDADNLLMPFALEQSLKIAERAHSRIAVVHPLLRVTPFSPPSSALQGNGIGWQDAHFLPSNYIDAMALVRRTAWSSVQGYSHIEGGWEDYDFWCKLVEHNWSGILCPQLLASYTRHEASMTTTTSLPSVKNLEACLQSRHPWLNCVGKTIV